MHHARRITHLHRHLSSGSTKIRWLTVSQLGSNGNGIGSGSGRGGERETEQECKKGDVVVIRAEGKEEICMVGVLDVGTEEMKKNKKGVAISAGHYLGDGVSLIPRNQGFHATSRYMYLDADYTEGTEEGSRFRL
jgi:hypothetical protein